jgi:regulator of RNase E activity RraA
MVRRRRWFFVCGVFVVQAAVTVLVMPARRQGSAVWGDAWSLTARRRGWVRMVPATAKPHVQDQHEDCDLWDG